VSLSTVTPPQLYFPSKNNCCIWIHPSITTVARRHACNLRDKSKGLFTVVCFSPFATSLRMYLVQQQNRWFWYHWLTSSSIQWLGTRNHPRIKTSTGIFDESKVLLWFLLPL
jgi:hypothetical protein